METKRIANDAYVSPVVDEIELLNEGIFCDSFDMPGVDEQ